MSQEWGEHRTDRGAGSGDPWHPAVDEIDGLDLLIPAPRRSPENIPVP